MLKPKTGKYWVIAIHCLKTSSSHFGEQDDHYDWGHCSEELTIFQNDEIFVQLDELGELNRIIYP